MPSIICNNVQDEGNTYTYQIGPEGETCRKDVIGTIRKEHVESVIRFRPCKNGSPRYCIKLKLSMFD